MDITPPARIAQIVLPYDPNASQMPAANTNANYLNPIIVIAAVAALLLVAAVLHKRRRRGAKYRNR